MEELVHESLDTTLEYEERHYGDTWWAKTTLTVTGQLDLIHHVTEGLARLKRYREGLNQKQENIAEKLPVLLRVQCDGDDCEQNRFVLYQYIGDGSNADPPNSTVDSVNVEKWTAFEAFVRPFEHLEEDDNFISEARNLRAFLAEFHVGCYYYDDFYYLANYDGVENLWKQRNEIWFIKQTD